jgi:hypothetical protein
MSRRAGDTTPTNDDDHRAASMSRRGIHRRWLLLLALALIPTLASIADSAPAPVPAQTDDWIDLKGLGTEAALGKLQRALDQLPLLTSRADMEAAFRRVAAEARDDSVVWRVQLDRLAVQRARARTAWEFNAGAQIRNLAEQKAAESTLETTRARVTTGERTLARLRSQEDAAGAALKAAILDRRSYWLITACRAISPEERAAHSPKELACATDSLAWEILNLDVRTLAVVSDNVLRETVGPDNHVQEFVQNIVDKRTRQFRLIDEPFILDVGTDSLRVIQICAVQQILTDNKKLPINAEQQCADARMSRPLIIFDPSNPSQVVPALTRLAENPAARPWLTEAAHRLREFNARSSTDLWKAEVARAGKSMAEIHKALRQAEDEQRLILGTLPNQQARIDALKKDGHEIDSRCLDAGKDRAAAEAAFNNHLARRTVQLLPGSAEEMTRKLDKDNVAVTVQNAKLPELFRRLRGNALKTYRHVSAAYIDAPSLEDWISLSRYGETGGAAPTLQRGRVFCKYSRENEEVGVGLELEITVEVPDGVLRQTAPIRRDDAMPADDAAARIAYSGSRLYKNLDVGPGGVTWEEAADRINVANTSAEQDRTNWRLPTPTELLELRDLAACPDQQTPCCTLQALAVRTTLRYWTSKIDQAAPGFRTCVAVSFSGNQPQLLDSPESNGCGVIVVSSD